MKLIKKVGAGVLFSGGFLCLMISLAGLVDPGTTEQEKQEAQDAVIAGLILGVPLSAGGNWIVWGLYRQAKKELSDRLQSTFYQLIKQGNGQITVLQFAMEAKLTPKLAKEYLDEKAKELDAHFTTNNMGGVYYHFHI